MEQRRKEIGIRKVLGASVSSIIGLFSLDLLRLIGFSLLMASPIAWWVMCRWLADYAYRITISPWIFVGAGMITSVVALVTIGFQASKAALANPASSLRND